MITKQLNNIINRSPKSVEELTNRFALKREVVEEMKRGQELPQQEYQGIILKDKDLILINGTYVKNQ